MLPGATGKKNGRPRPDDRKVLNGIFFVLRTGVPRTAAIRFIEASEGAPRRWYGGAIGRIGFDGRIDTGIALRSIRLADGVADMRVGASILHSSVPEDEE